MLKTFSDHEFEYFKLCAGGKVPLKGSKAPFPRDASFKVSKSNNLGIDAGYNHLTFVDVDYNNMIQDQHTSFLDKFPDFETRWNTCCVKTPNGFHLYFLHNHNIPGPTQNHATHVDIRHNKNSYVVAPTSVVKDGRSYKILHDFTIKTMPPELEKWILSNLYSTTKEKVLKKQHEERDNKKKGITEESLIVNQVSCWGTLNPLTPNLLETIFNHHLPKDKNNHIY
jgi:hypothetical protein